MSEENENKKEVEIQEESAPEYDGDELKVIQAYQDKCKVCYCLRVIFFVYTLAWVSRVVFAF